ncbi:type II secretion system protein [Candidatus Nomurabacteria bacterium]|uniref:Type II secretion system protein n=1 Tax=candidate division WWE3 bacterium TaxID=2053526 RepID=A0A955E125_UNCKA|nr:type II secretion system protein [candidate division WWE3 bacterium]MCB9823989.1 type II secretion system protein [Candidatus Nomurabacteria bacterium]MCB9827041.1 type II secretion system protein [Candidatus Nomurabacteria bacterium]MCB9827929.1 type II secretion system protein [Candidatus Nomurabacteria bacterium]HXK52874.1 type II secretion system protein [bacterium]
MNHKFIFSPDSGFTLIELMLVIGLFAVLSSFVAVNLARPQVTSSVDKNANTIIADIKKQQLDAMVGKYTSDSTENKGIYFETNSYTLFSGNSYNAEDPNNFTINVEEGTTLTSINLPSNQLVFEHLSGEISGYISGNSSITISHSGGQSITISLNKMGGTNVIKN